MLTNHTTFFGYTYSMEQADIAIFGAPFDSTASNRPGTRFAPALMRLDSINLETYSPYQKVDLTEIKVADLGDLELAFGNAQKVLADIYAQTKIILDVAKIPVMLGGEHLLTLGAVRAVHEVYPDLNMIHIDAHTDLREEYLGEELSHATVIRHCCNLLEPKAVHSFGVRSGLREEFEFAAENLNFYPFALDQMQELTSLLGNKPVYVTLDLDVLDPAFFPGTGTPEPGGVTFKELLQNILHLRNLNIVGFDIVELCPPEDLTGISAAAACKILREMLIIAGNAKNSL
ncbi:MAG TPA: agmatinase [Clostridiaceae bacterium]|nr:agmatinase [Clostridiaceae bacterium]